MPSGRNPPLVILLQAGNLIPEGLRLRASHAGGQDVEVGVPAGADAEQGRALGHAAVDQGEQGFCADGLEGEGDAAGGAPGDGKLFGRVELGDPAVQPVLLGRARGALARRGGELVVAPDEGEGRVRRQNHLARREPLPAQPVFREIGPDPLHGAGEEALDREGVGLGQHAIGVGGELRGGKIIHGSLLRAWGLCGHPPREGAGRGHPDGWSRSVRSA